MKAKDLSKYVYKITKRDVEAGTAPPRLEVTICDFKIGR